MAQMVKKLPVVQETLEESPVDSKEMKLAHPEDNEPRIFIGRTDAEVEVQVLWSPDAKSHLIGKDPVDGKD